ncbi:hypothetical protein [Rhizobium rhizophilum]
MITNRAAFFAAVRSSLFGGRLSESQVAGWKPSWMSGRGRA